MASSNEISATDKIYSLSKSVSDKNYESVKKNLKALVSELMNSDFISLTQLLYRIDVDEKKLKEHIARNTGEESADVITNFIIERQLEKITTRNKFAGSKPPPSEDTW